MNLARLLRRASRLAGERVAVFSGDTPSADFRSLESRAAGLAATCNRSLGLERGDRVLILARNCPEYLEVLFGCWYAGLLAVPINARLHPREIAYIVHDTEARACFASTELLETAAAAAGQAGASMRIVELGSAEFRRMRSSGPPTMTDTEPDDAAWLFYTSGTTGLPKGAVLTHRNLLEMSLSYLTDVNPVASTECLLHAAPMSHGSGIYALPYVAAMASQAIPLSSAFEPTEVWELIRVHGQVSMFAAPTMLDRLLTHMDVHQVDVDRLKVVVVGGAPFYTESAKRAVGRLGARVAQIYGQGESPMTISALPSRVYAATSHPAYEQRIASVGYPHSVVEVRVADERGHTCAVGDVGEVLVKGGTVMKGYWRNPQATAATLRDGWLHTGDLGAFDVDGFLTLKGRSKELIISGGSNIYPREIEDVLLSHPGIAEAAVIGRRHLVWGEEVIAFVVPKSGLSVDGATLDAWCLNHVARYKRPKHYRMMTSLPKNAYGKVLKSELAEIADEGRPHGHG